MNHHNLHGYLSISALKIAEILRNNNLCRDIIEIKKVGRNRVVVHFSSIISANNIIDSPVFASRGYKTYIPSYLISRCGIIKGVDIDYTDEQLLHMISCNSYNINYVKRLNRRITVDGEVKYVPSSSVLISFEGQRLPSYVFMWHVRYNCEPFIRRTRQCYSCLRYGHVSAQCKSSSRCARCGNRDHTEPQCSSQTATCLFCGEFHKSTDSICPERSRQIKINELMALRNLSFQEASSEFPKTYQQINLFSNRVRNRFSLLTDYNDFPEISHPASDHDSHNIPTYKPPPISKKTGFFDKNQLAPRRDHPLKRSLSSDEEKKDLERKLTHKKTSFDDQNIRSTYTNDRTQNRIVSTPSIKPINLDINDHAHASKEPLTKTNLFNTNKKNLESNVKIKNVKDSKTAMSKK